MYEGWIDFSSYSVTNPLQSLHEERPEWISFHLCLFLDHDLEHNTNKRLYDSLRDVLYY